MESKSRPVIQVHEVSRAILMISAASIRNPIPRTQIAKCCKLLQHQICQPSLCCWPSLLQQVCLVCSFTLRNKRLSQQRQTKRSYPFINIRGHDQTGKWQTLPCGLWIFKYLRCKNANYGNVSRGFQFRIVKHPSWATAKHIWSTDFDQ